MTGFIRGKMQCSTESLPGKRTMRFQFSYRTLAILVATFSLCFFSNEKQLRAQSSVAPCTKVSAACTEWVTLGGGPAKSIVYTTFPLKTPNASIRRALIMVHGALRNPNQAFATATTAAFLGGALEDTIVISPGFNSSEKGCGDKLEQNEVNWSCHKDSWRSGGNSINYPELTSFDFADELLRMLADKKVFPNLTHVVLAGHSAGGQFVTRYEMANRVHDSLGIQISYVVANPSSYAWPTATRVLPVKDGAPENGMLAWKETAPHTDFKYGPFDPKNAPAYNAWPYGLENRTSGYTAKMTDEQLRKQLASRPTTYLVGELDIFPLALFDATRSAMAQGPTRRARGEAFVKYINENLGANGKLMIVSGCGHNGRCIYTTTSVLKLIFPKP